MRVCVSIPRPPHRQKQALYGVECRGGLKWVCLSEGGKRGRRNERLENNETDEMRGGPAYSEHFHKVPAFEEQSPSARTL